MTDTSEALKRIETYFDEFCRGVERCRRANSFDPADWKDAYGRLARLKDRYEFEKRNLSPPERRALSKVFDNDVFTVGMLNIRQAGEHVIKRGDFTIRTASNEPIILEVGSSALAVFSGPKVVLDVVDGATHSLDHLEMLDEQVKRIRAVIRKAQGR